jgi:hypothetical protein
MKMESKGWWVWISFGDVENILKWGDVVVHSCDPSTQEVEAGGIVSLRPAWAT